MAFISTITGSSMLCVGVCLLHRVSVCVSPITVSVCYSPGVPEILKEAAGNRSARSCLRRRDGGSLAAVW